MLQAAILAELGGLTVPNTSGDLPLFENDPARPNPAYFAHVNAAIDLAASLGFHTGLLPTWGDKWNRKWGLGPEVFTPENAQQYRAVSCPSWAVSCSASPSSCSAATGWSPPSSTD